MADAYDNAYLYIEDTIEPGEGSSLTAGGETPKAFLQGFIQKNNAKDGPPLIPALLKYPDDKEYFRNFNVFLKFHFKGDACYVIQVYGVEPNPPTIEPKTHAVPVKMYHNFAGTIRHALKFTSSYRRRREHIRVTGRGSGTSFRFETPGESKRSKDGKFIAARSAGYYAGTMSGIAAAEFGMWSHGHNFDKSPRYNDQRLFSLYYERIRKGKQFYFNLDLILTLITNYANNYRNIVPEKIIAEAEGKAHAVCECLTGEFYRYAVGYNRYSYYYYRQNHNYFGWRQVQALSTSKSNVTLVMRPTFTTTLAQVTTTTTCKYSTKHFGYIHIPYVTQVNQWCFFRTKDYSRGQQRVFCYNASEGWNDDNMPPSVWRYTPPP